MAEGSYENECSRAELLGIAPPNFEDWQEIDRVRRENEHAAEMTVRMNYSHFWLLDAQSLPLFTHSKLTGIRCTRRAHHTDCWQNGRNQQYSVHDTNAIK